MWCCLKNGTARIYAIAERRKGVTDMPGGGDWRRLAVLLFYLCAAASATQMLLSDREGAFGFRSACALAIALCLLTALIGLFGLTGSS